VITHSGYCKLQKIGESKTNPVVFIVLTDVIYFSGSSSVRSEQSDKHETRDAPQLDLHYPHRYPTPQQHQQPHAPQPQRSQAPQVPSQPQALPLQLSLPVIVDVLNSNHSQQAPEFNFDEFFNIDSIPGLGVVSVRVDHSRLLKDALADNKSAV
jgi:hypothetical protein